MTEMNAVNTGDNNNENGGGMGFFKKFFDKNTIIAFAAVFIMAISQHKLFGFWGIVLLAILGPIGATIGNVIRLWVMPNGIFTFQGFWGLVKIKLFWAYLYSDEEINIPRDQAMELKEKLASQNTRVNYMVRISTHVATNYGEKPVVISYEPFLAITYE